MRGDSPQWTAAKARGDAGEVRVTALLRARGFHVLIQAPGEAPAFDLLAHARLEVKTDLAAQRTGNAALEISYRDTPSGISTTRADLWAFIIGGEVLIAAVSALRALLASNRFPIKRGGDNNASQFAIIPLAELRRAALLVLPGVPE